MEDGVRWRLASHKEVEVAVEENTGSGLGEYVASVLVPMHSRWTSRSHLALTDYNSCGPAEATALFSRT